jgi:hypothetical protein
MQALRFFNLSNRRWLHPHALLKYKFQQTWFTKEKERKEDAYKEQR